MFSHFICQVESLGIRGHNVGKMRAIAPSRSPVYNMCYAITRKREEKLILDLDSDKLGLEGDWTALSRATRNGYSHSLKKSARKAMVKILDLHNWDDVACIFPQRPNPTMTSEQEAGEQEELRKAEIEKKEVDDAWTKRKLEMAKFWRRPESPPTLSLETVPKPTFKLDHVLVKIHAASLQQSDKMNAKGLFAVTTYPRTPGRDFSGTIVDGPDELIGEPVYGTGGSALGFTVDGVHAEYCLVPQEAVVRKPESLSYLQAASVGVPFTTALLCLQRARATENDVVLVLGATGAVGSATVQGANAIGCRRVITASRRDKLSQLLSGEHDRNDARTASVV
ncbi:chaperonin 10-like protein [Lipomyces mesembrius]